MNLFLDNIKKTIEYHSMISHDDEIIVGFSGGADSVSLVYSLKELGYKIIAVHINHMIRGDEAYRDENFVVDFCKSHSIPLKIYRKNVPEIAKEKGISEELAGRNIRYLCFNEALEETNASKIAVAHNMDDSLETMIFNLLRGSGMKGLCGIPPVNGNIVRPLINTKRKDIEKFLRSNKIKHIVDSTNNDDIYSRNIIRNCITPHFDRINPSFLDNAKRCADIIREEDEYIQKKTDEYIKKYCSFPDGLCEIIIDKEEDQVIIRRVLIECICQLVSYSVDLSYRNITDILSLKTGKSFHFGNKLHFARAYNKIIISCDIDKAKNYYYDVSDEFKPLFIDETEETIIFEIITNRNMINYSEINTTYIDLDKLGKLTIRNRREGDTFVPSGMKNNKKLKDFYIDSKIPNNLRNNLPILCSDDNIAAIIGIRTSELFKVDINTKNILKITRGTKDES